MEESKEEPRRGKDLLHSWMSSWRKMKSGKGGGKFEDDKYRQV